MIKKWLCNLESSYSNSWILQYQFRFPLNTYMKWSSCKNFRKININDNYLAFLYKFWTLIKKPFFNSVFQLSNHLFFSSPSVNPFVLSLPTFEMLNGLSFVMFQLLWFYYNVLVIILWKICTITDTQFIFIIDLWKYNKIFNCIPAYSWDNVTQ